MVLFINNKANTVISLKKLQGAVKSEKTSLDGYLFVWDGLKLQYKKRGGRFLDCGRLFLMETHSYFSWM